MRSVVALSLAKSMFSTLHLRVDLARGLLRDDAEPALHARQRRLDLEIAGGAVLVGEHLRASPACVKMSRKIIESRAVAGMRTP